MAGISEAMSGMASGRHGGIAERMHGAEPKREPESEHGSVGEHLKALHSEMGGTHMHVHKEEGGGYTSHHVKDGGKVEGPHEHQDTEELKEHVGRVFNEEENEPRSEDHGDGLM